VGPALHWLSMIQQRPKPANVQTAVTRPSKIFSENGVWCQEAVGQIYSQHKLYLSKVVCRLGVVHLYICMGMINVS
jgi:hypothetical protein